MGWEGRQLLPEYAKNVMRKYARWLNRRYHDTYARKWGRLCRNDVEAGAMEAVAWAILCGNDVDVEPYDVGPQGQPRPDFLCKRGRTEFYAEATCMKVENVAETTGLPSEFDLNSGATEFGLLTQSVFNEVRGKTKQCAGSGAPCVLLVGTFHWHASCVCVQEHFVEQLLTGKTGISVVFDTLRDEPVGEPHQTTRLESAAFVRPGKDSPVERARCSVSAVVLCGLGCTPPNMCGALHPQAAHSFNPAWLPRLPFCRLDKGYEQGSLGVSWVNQTQCGDQAAAGLENGS